jgi:hypothetical protein
MIEFETLKQYSLVYLASPYSKFPGGMDLAHTEICEIGSKLVKLGVKVFSPIAHCHIIASMSSDLDPTDYKIWMEQNHPMEQASEALIIACMDGWKKSEGLAIEYVNFRLREAPVYLLKPVEWKLFEVAQSRRILFDVHGYGG